MKKPYRYRDDVYIIGAGFSAGLGYPVTEKLLFKTWQRLSESEKRKVGKVIRFHYPFFNPKKKETYPDIEKLLTVIKVNEDLFDASRPVTGNFKKEELENVREILLYEITSWFHEIYKKSKNIKWLKKFINRINSENAGIISFNWDLVLEHLLFDENSLSHGYGLRGNLKKNNDAPVLLKPHGSLNWYEESQVNKVKNSKKIIVYKGGGNNIEAFLFPRKIISKSNIRYLPLIIPPTYMKEFHRPIFKKLWRHATDLLSTAKNIYILGYSLPEDDLHAEFILRCGFHNQKEGRLKSNGERGVSTGLANVYIVNPDKKVKIRFDKVTGTGIKNKFINKKVEDWLEETNN